MNHKKTSLRVLELYSGIGGMRYALELAGIPHEIVAAIDVNPVVNYIYCHNFGNSNHFQKNILSITPKELDKMKLDIITMSPPCQPFTRVGLKKDIEDARSCSFLHILNVISELQNKPTYILLENVKGFEDSIAHNILIDVLRNCSYNFQEFLLSPVEFGIPNSRLRYYIIAKLKPIEFSFPITNEILIKIPELANLWKTVCKICCQEEMEKCPIRHFLEEVFTDKLLIPDSILLKYANILDIVYENSYQSCCFTKAYGRYTLGTGSIFSPSTPIEVEKIFQKISSESESNEKLESLKTLKLRYFTPREVANLMCFPSTFCIPPTISDKQMYKALGNSINIFVVSCLMKLLIKDL